MTPWGSFDPIELDDRLDPEESPFAGKKRRSRLVGRDPTSGGRLTPRNQSTVQIQICCLIVLYWVCIVTGRTARGTVDAGDVGVGERRDAGAVRGGRPEGRHRLRGARVDVAGRRRRAGRRAHRADAVRHAGRRRLRHRRRLRRAGAQPRGGAGVAALAAPRVARAVHRRRPHLLHGTQLGFLFFFHFARIPSKLTLGDFFYPFLNQVRLSLYCSTLPSFTEL